MPSLPLFAKQKHHRNINQNSRNGVNDFNDFFDDDAFRFIRGRVSALVCYLNVITDTSQVTSNFPSLWKQHHNTSFEIQRQTKLITTALSPYSILSILGKI